MSEILLTFAIAVMALFLTIQMGITLEQGFEKVAKAIRDGNKTKGG